MTAQEKTEILQFVWEALTRIIDRQERHSPDTSEDLTDITNAIARLREDENE